MFSERSRIDRTPNAIARARRLALDAKKTLWDLTQSNPTAADLPYDQPALSAALGTAAASRYRPDPMGWRPARQAVVADLRRRGIEANADRTLLTASTSEAYAHLFKLLCDPGDDVLVPRPSYPLLEHLTRLEHVHVRPYALAYDGRWHIDLASLRHSVGERTRAVVVVHPNNPTGHYVSRHEIEVLQELGLPVISDEVFGPYVLQSHAPRHPSLQGVGDLLVFSLFGLSKRAGLPGLKLAWTCGSGSEPLLSEAWARLEIIADTFLSVHTPIQSAAAEILQASRPTFEAIGHRLRDNLAHLQGTTRGGPTTLLHVEGGWYAILQLPAVLDEETWVLQLLDQAGVYVQPGYFFDFAQEPFIVLSLLTPPHVFREGVKRLLDHVERVVGRRS